MCDRNEDHLLRLAESIADRKHVDWEREDVPDASTRERIRRLRILESIAAVYGMPEDGTGPVPFD